MDIFKPPGTLRTFFCTQSNIIAPISYKPCIEHSEKIQTSTTKQLTNNKFSE